MELPKCLKSIFFPLDLSFCMSLFSGLNEAKLKLIGAHNPYYFDSTTLIAETSRENLKCLEYNVLCLENILDTND